MPTETPRRPDEPSIPALAQKATRAVYEKALASGTSVLIGRGGTVVRISPDGSEHVVKTKTKPTSVKVGSTWSLKSSTKTTPRVAR